MGEQKPIGADVRTDVKWTKWGWMTARHFRGAGDGLQGRFEDKPYKTTRRLSIQRFLIQLEKEISLPAGSLHLGLRYSLLLLALLVSDKLTKAGIHTAQAPLIAGAIALDGSVTSSDASDTVSVTVAANSDRMLIVAFGTYQGNDPSGITHSGSAMTELVDAIGSYGESCGLWGRVAPASGTANVVVSGAANYRGISIYSLYNVDQTLPATTAEAGGDSSTASLAITPTVDNCWIIWSLEMEAVPTMTTSSGVSDAVQEGDVYQHVAASHFVQTTAASKTGSYSGSYGSRWNITACVVKPVADAGGQPTMRREITIPHSGRNGKRFAVTLSQALKALLPRSLNFNT